MNRSAKSPSVPVVNSSVSARMVKGSIWLTLSRAIVNGLNALSTIVLAWYLIPDDFGLVAIAMTLLAIIKSITELSIAQVLIRHPDPQESHFHAAWTIGATRGLVLGLLFAAAAYPVATFYDDPRLVDVILALSLSLFMTGLSNPRRIMLQRQLIFWQDFTLNVSQKVVGFVVTVGIAMVYQTYWALVLGTLAYQLTNIIVSYTVLPFWPRITFKHLGEFFSFSIWLTLGQIVNTLNWRFEYLLIGKLLGAGPLGHYTVGNTLSTLPTREATLPLTQTIYPGFANVRDNPARLRNAYQRAQALVTAIALPAGIGFALLAEPLVLLVMGEKWSGVIFIVQALASVFALQTLGSLVQPLGMAKGETKLLFIRDTQMLFVRMPIIVGSLLLWGLAGVVCARVFTGLLSSLVNMFLVRRLIDLPVIQQLKANLRALAGVAAMSAGVWLLLGLIGPGTTKLEQGFHIALLAAAGGVIYTGTSLLLWLAMHRPAGPETEIRQILGQIAGKLRRRPVAPKST